MSDKFLPIGLILLAGAIGYFYMYPAYTDTIVPAQQQISTYNKALDAAAAFTKNEQQLLIQSQAISPADLDRLQSYMPDSIDTIQYISDLNHIAGSNGVVLSGFTLTPGANNITTSASSSSASSGPSSSGATNTLDLTVSATGTYASVNSFIIALEESAPVLDILKVAITSTDTGVYKYSLTIRTYWLP